MTAGNDRSRIGRMDRRGGVHGRSDGANRPTDWAMRLVVGGSGDRAGVGHVGGSTPQRATAGQGSNNRRWPSWNTTWCGSVHGAGCRPRPSAAGGAGGRLPLGSRIAGQGQCRSYLLVENRRLPLRRPCGRWSSRRDSTPGSMRTGSSPQPGQAPGLTRGVQSVSGDSSWSDAFGLQPGTGQRDPGCRLGPRVDRALPASGRSRFER